MVVTKIRGGLGNQLFTYAAGRYLALRHRTPLVLDISWYATGPRTFLLEHFHIAGSINASDLSAADDGIGYNQEHWHHYASFENFTGSKFLSGWWQSEKFFAGAADQLRRDLQLRDQLLVESAVCLRGGLMGSDYDYVVAVHCRRGDYVALAEERKFTLLSPEYYKSAMRRFGGRPLFLFFSDDIPWCRKQFDGPSIAFCEETDPLKALAIMSSCDHFIIANSTFSWWGAWLGEKEKTRVYAPPHEIWFGPELVLARGQTADIVPARWCMLDIASAD